MKRAILVSRANEQLQSPTLYFLANLWAGFILFAAAGGFWKWLGGNKGVNC